MSQSCEITREPSAGAWGASWQREQPGDAPGPLWVGEGPPGTFIARGLRGTAIPAVGLPGNNPLALSINK